ncbi:acyl-CoA dehydrogenase family protein [Rhodococcus sp. NPDC057014]|uniref:acyl-CoA dehydrogenase family protein n=1 Tax=Rhodococcus sp. NPDC057014 TaxID=3346000 RepID=UPI003628DB5B
MLDTDLCDILTVLRDFVRKEAVPLEQEVEESDSVPVSLTEKMKDLGLYGYGLPEEYGGMGMTVLQQSRVMAELSWSSAVQGHTTNNGLAGAVIREGGTERQRKEWLPQMAAGEIIASFALTEPTAGSDPSTMLTTAHRDSDGWLIHGIKTFITYAPHADLFLVFARTNPEVPGKRGISGFLVPTDTPGVTVGPPDQKMGLRGSPTADVYLDQVRVPADALVGGERGLDRGFVIAAKCLALGRLMIAASSVGMATRLVHELTEYAQTREQGGGPIGRFQLVQGLVADAVTDLHAGRALLESVAAAYDAGADTVRGPSVAKYFCSEMLGRVADRAVQIHGGAGYMRGTTVERLYRDARVARIYDGTSQVLQVLIARDVLGEAARA